MRKNLYYLVTQRIAQKSVLLFIIRPTQNVAQKSVLLFTIRPTQNVAQKSVLLFTIRPTQKIAQSFVLPPPFPPAAKGVAYSDSCYLPANRLLPTKQWAAAY